MRAMSKLMKLTTFVLATTAMVAPTGAAAVDFFLTLGPVKSGEGSAKTREAAARIGVGQPIEIQSYSWGASQPSSRPIKMGDGRIAAADYDGDGRADRAVSSPRGGAGLAAGKRTHKPLNRGSVTLAGKFPSCTVGAAYEDAVLQVSGARYRFEDVVITACGPSGSSAGVPSQSLSYNYLKHKLN